MNIKEIKAMAPATEPARQKYFMEHVKASVNRFSASCFKVLMWKIVTLKREMR